MKSAAQMERSELPLAVTTTSLQPFTSTADRRTQCGFPMRGKLKANENNANMLKQSGGQAHKPFINL